MGGVKAEASEAARALNKSERLALVRFLTLDTETHKQQLFAKERVE